MVQLIADNHVLVDGDILANANHANELRTSGASGGSIWISGDSFSGKLLKSGPRC